MYTGVAAYVCMFVTGAMNKVYSLICMYTAKLNKNSTESWTAGSTFLVQYASDDGLVISNDLVGMIQSWLLNSSSGCIAIGGSTFQLIRGCSSSQVSTVHSGGGLITSYLPKEGLSVAHIAAGTIGGFVGGVLLTICIGACVIIR